VSCRFPFQSGLQIFDAIENFPLNLRLGHFPVPTGTSFSDLPVEPVDLTAVFIANGFWTAMKHEISLKMI
jgi:hypothetical protein